MPIPIELTPAQEAQLRSVAQQLGVAPEVLARSAVEDLLERPQPDFEEASRRILEKNRELYDRLS
jgi:aspartate/methionine/tyrosine aminotransferase